MTVASIKKTQPQNIIPIEATECSCWGKFGNLIQSVTITTLDVIFLLGSVFSSIPKVVTDAAFSALNFSGLLSWSFYIDQTKKNIDDVCFSFKKSNHLMTFASSLKTVFVAASLGLTALNCSAAAFRLVNCLAVTQKIYTFIRPFGFPFLALSFVLDAVYYYIEKQTLKTKLNEAELGQFYLNLSQTDCPKNNLDAYTSYVRGCVDKDTWKHLIKHLPNALHDKQKQEELYHRVLIPNIATQQTAAVSNFFLRLLGEVGMCVSIIYPGTAIQAACWTVLSSLYTGQLLHQHYHQYKQRKITSSIILSV